MAYRYWPLFDLRLTTPDLALRPMAEADLAAIADRLFGADVEITGFGPCRPLFGLPPD